MFLMDTLAKISHNIFAYSFVQNILSIFFILRKKPCILAAGGGVDPPHSGRVR